MSSMYALCNSMGYFHFKRWCSFSHIYTHFNVVFLQMEPLKLLIERLNYKHLSILNPNEIERDRPNFSKVPFKFNLVWSMFRVDHMKLKKSIVLPLSLGAKLYSRSVNGSNLGYFRNEFLIGFEILFIIIMIRKDSHVSIISTFC